MVVYVVIDATDDEEDIVMGVFDSEQEAQAFVATDPGYVVASGRRDQHILHIEAFVIGIPKPWKDQ